MFNSKNKLTEGMVSSRDDDLEEEWVTSWAAAVHLINWAEAWSSTTEYSVKQCHSNIGMDGMDVSLKEWIGLSKSNHT